MWCAVAHIKKKKKQIKRFKQLFSFFLFYICLDNTKVEPPPFAWGSIRVESTQFWTWFDFSRVSRGQDTPLVKKNRVEIIKLWGLVAGPLAEFEQHAENTVPLKKSAHGGSGAHQVKVKGQKTLHWFMLNIRRLARFLAWFTAIRTAYSNTCCTPRLLKDEHST